MFALDQGRYTVAAGATGPDPRRAATPASKYANERKTFGVEIGQHQLVKEMIAQMEIGLPGRAAAVAALRLAEESRAGATRARPGLAKWFATVASERAAGDAVQIHGANGYSDEVSGRALLPQLQGRGHLRRHARDPQDHAGRLSASATGPIGRRRCELPAYDAGQARRGRAAAN